MIRGINHITLSIHDLPTSFDFYTRVLGARPIAKWNTGAYLVLGDVWLALVRDEKTRAASNPDYSHIAFTVSSSDFARVCDRIKNSGATIWQENWTEGDSLYFLDPNGHKLEIHVGDLQSRLTSAKEKPWAGLEFFE
ncbi:MAG: VOC family protein [Chloroflexi bacterium]|nr:VOC family protein [Chloroflexota bacterium]